MQVSEEALPVEVVKWMGAGGHRRVPLLLIGPPGNGKSRIMEMMKTEVSQNNGTTICFDCEQRLQFGPAPKGTTVFIDNLQWELDCRDGVAVLAALRTWVTDGALDLVMAVGGNRRDEALNQISDLWPEVQVVVVDRPSDASLKRIVSDQMDQYPYPIENGVVEDVCRRAASAREALMLAIAYVAGTALREQRRIASA